MFARCLVPLSRGGPPTPVPIGGKGSVPFVLKSLQDPGGFCSTNTLFLFSQRCRGGGDPKTLLTASHWAGMCIESFRAM